MSRIYQYPVVTEISSDDYLALGSATNGSRSILASDLAPVIGNKTITERGTYKASDDNMDGYGQVTVDIPYTDIHVASGDIATFEGEDLPLKSLKVAVTPYQDLHGYDGPWAGGAGKNKFDYDGIEAISNLSNNNGTFTNTATDTRTIFSLAIQQYNDTTYIKGNTLNISESGRYSVPFTVDAEITKLRIKHNGATKEFRFDYPFTKQGTYCLSLTVISANPTVVGGLSFKDIMIEEGSTATSFAPYSNICPIIGWDEAVVTVADDVDNPTVEHEYTIDLDGTRYGGELDVLNGVDIDTLGSVDLGTLTWIKENNHFYSNFLSDANPPSSNSQPANMLCETYKNMAYSEVITETNDASICLSNSKRLYIYDSTKTSLDATAFKTAMQGVQLVYELATPITVQLAPTAVKSLEGTNNIFADCGAVDVEYQTVWVRPSN